MFQFINEIIKAKNPNIVFSDDLFAEIEPRDL
jgi:hypothetical protein